MSYEFIVRVELEVEVLAEDEGEALRKATEVIDSAELPDSVSLVDYWIKDKFEPDDP